MSEDEMKVLHASRGIMEDKLKIKLANTRDARNVVNILVLVFLGGVIAWDWTRPFGWPSLILLVIFGFWSLKLGVEVKKFENDLLLQEIENKTESMVQEASEREKALDYDSAIEIWEELGEIKQAARVRKLKARQGSVRVAQKVVHGDEITKTEIKDSVVSKSSIGSGSSKMQELEKLIEMKEKGLIDDDEFQQMKKEILGK